VNSREGERPGSECSFANLPRPPDMRDQNPDLRILEPNAALIPY
jgi:hypothetical protein